MRCCAVEVVSWADSSSCWSFFLFLCWDASVASSASAAAVSASVSAVAMAVVSALGLVAVPPAWRFGTVAVAVPVPVPVVNPAVVSASAPSSTGGYCGGLVVCLRFKGDFLLALGGSSFGSAVLGAFGTSGLGSLFL